MAKQEIISFRPRNEFMRDWDEIREWCIENDSSVSAVINSFLPAISYALKLNVVEDLKKGKRYIRADFGDIELIETCHH